MIRIFIFSFLLLSIWIVPLAVLAQEGPIEYKPLVELPINFGGGGADGEPTTEDYVRILYTLSITVAALLAVVKIIFGGVKYMLSDVVTTKAGAKKDIQGALLGLLIVVGAVLILETINPQITRLNLLGNAPGVGIGLGDYTAETLPDAYVGNTLNTAEPWVTPTVIEQFENTCPGHINRRVSGGTGGATIMTCDEERDVTPTGVNFSCSGNTCTCTHSNQRGVCMSMCQTNPPQNTEFVSAQDTVANTTLSCNYRTLSSRACNDFPIITCTSGESDCTPPAENICREQNNGLSSTYYGYAQ